MNGDGGGDDDGGGGDGDNEADRVSAIRARQDVQDLPADLMEALRAGRIGATELANWKAVASNPVARLLALSSYARARLIAEPRLMSIIAIEVLVGCAATLAAERVARDTYFFDELDYVLANQALIVFTNVALALVLSPAAAIGTPAASSSAGASLARLPGYLLQKGDFSAWQRAACFAARALQFSYVGCCTSAVSQATTLGLLNVRAKLDRRAPPQVELPPTLPTAATYAAFMASSTHTRYQLLNCLEAAVLPALPGGAVARTAVSCVMRTYNTYIGSLNWAWWTRVVGVQ